MGKEKKVLLYTVAWCPHCVAIISFLNSNGVKYKNFDVEAKDSWWKEALSRTGGEDIVPVIDVDGQVIWGVFNQAFEDNLKKLLGLK